VIADLFWKPFDSRFEALLARMRSHQALFHSELQLEESRFMEMQFEKRENDAEMTKDAMEQIQRQINELRESNRIKEAHMANALDELNERLLIISDTLGEDKRDEEEEAKLLGMSRNPLLLSLAHVN
jgi:hypothetical protein